MASGQFSPRSKLQKVDVATTHTPGCSYTYSCDGCTSIYLLGW